MATKKIRYLVTKPGAAGPRHFWQPSKDLKHAGWLPRRLVDDSGRPIVDEVAAMAAAQQINRALDLWREGNELPPELAIYAPRQAEPNQAAEIVKAGSVDHLVLRFKKSLRFVKNGPTTRKNYEYAMRIIAGEFG